PLAPGGSRSRACSPKGDRRSAAPPAAALLTGLGVAVGPACRPFRPSLCSRSCICPRLRSRWRVVVSALYAKCTIRHWVRPEPAISVCEVSHISGSMIATIAIVLAQANLMQARGLEIEVADHVDR